MENRRETEREREREREREEEERKHRVSIERITTVPRVSRG